MRSMNAREISEDRTNDYSIDEASVSSRESTTGTEHDGIIFRAINKFSWKRNDMPQEEM